MLKDRIFNLIAKNERLKNDVSNAKELNKRHDYYSNKLNKYSEIKENLYNYLSILNAILLRCEVEDTKFKERRLEFLEQDIQEYFSLVFPEDGFTPKLYYKHYKGKPIAWQILDTREHQVLLISRDVIEEMAYNTEYKAVNWDNSSIRKWLKEDFYNSFDESEKKKLLKNLLVDTL